MVGPTYSRNVLVGGDFVRRCNAYRYRRSTNLRNRRAFRPKRAGQENQLQRNVEDTARLLPDKIGLLLSSRGHHGPLGLGLFGGLLSQPCAFSKVLTMVNVYFIAIYALAMVISGKLRNV